MEGERQAAVEERVRSTSAPHRRDPCWLGVGRAHLPCVGDESRARPWRRGAGACRHVPRCTRALLLPPRPPYVSHRRIGSAWDHLAPVAGVQSLPSPALSRGRSLAISILPRRVSCLTRAHPLGVGHRAARACHLLARHRRRLPHLPRKGHVRHAAHPLHLLAHPPPRSSHAGHGLRSIDAVVERLPRTLRRQLRQRAHARAALLASTHAVPQGLLPDARAEESVERTQVLHRLPARVRGLPPSSLPESL
mmetsp:Transcript_29467/g.63435  ORF Transcript_29467/g.63435 Transcript_29467/m.63435 type:complete len:250 (-) Transcript_29467:661-1410(-)